MEGSDEEEARVPLPETPPVKTKTLFHYFKSTPGSNSKKEVEDKSTSQVQVINIIAEAALCVQYKTDLK
jgi:hypothetical protein